MQLKILYIYYLWINKQCSLTVAHFCLSICSNDLIILGQRQPLGFLCCCTLTLDDKNTQIDIRQVISPTDRP